MKKVCPRCGAEMSFCIRFSRTRKRILPCYLCDSCMLKYYGDELKKINTETDRTEKK